MGSSAHGAAELGPTWTLAPPASPTFYLKQSPTSTPPLPPPPPAQCPGPCHDLRGGQQEPPEPFCHWLYTWPAGPRFAERLWAAQSHTLVSAGLRARTGTPFLPSYPTENVRQKCVENEISNEVLSQLCKDETCTYVHKGDEVKFPYYGKTRKT